MWSRSIIEGSAGSVDKVALIKRLINGSLIIALTVIIIFFFPNWVFSILASVVIGLALHELFGLAQKKGIFVYKYFALVTPI